MRFEDDCHHDTCIAFASKQDYVKSDEHSKVKQVYGNMKNDMGQWSTPHLSPGANIPKCSQHVGSRCNQKHEKDRKRNLKHANKELTQCSPMVSQKSSIYCS